MKSARILDVAIAVAVRAHAGQVDKAGQPYIRHPLRVMARMNDTISKAVAVLHDVIEDCGITAQDLVEAGLPEEVVSRVEILSRREGESYMQFIDRIAPDPVARKVKMEDLKDNMDLSRLPQVSDSDVKRNAKYQKAWLRLDRFERDATAPDCR